MSNKFALSDVFRNVSLERRRPPAPWEADCVRLNAWGDALNRHREAAEVSGDAGRSAIDETGGAWPRLPYPSAVHDD